MTLSLAGAGLDHGVLALGLVLFLGAFIQSTIGFGINVVSAPVVFLLRPDLVPGALVLVGFVLPIVQLARRTPPDVAWRPLSWTLLARLLTTPLGVWLVVTLDQRWVATILGVTILLTVLVSLRSVQIRPTFGNALVSGVLSGISGVTAAVGGPFTALLFQHEPPPRLRDTLAVSFIVGSAMSAAGLALAGQLRGEDLVAVGTWLPFIAVGYLASAPARRRLDAAALRPLVLAFCAVAAVVVIVRAFLA